MLQSAGIALSFCWVPVGVALIPVAQQEQPQEQSQEQPQDLGSRVENYLRSTGIEELNPEGIGRDFKTLLEDPEAGLEGLRDRLGQFDRDTLVQLLKGRQDISSEEADQIISQLESTRDSVLTTAQELQDAAKSKAQELCVIAVAGTSFLG